MEPGRTRRRPVLFPDGKARLNVTPYVGPAEDVDERVSRHPHHRPRRQPVPVREPDAAHRSAGGSVSRAADRDAPAAGRRGLASPTATGRRSRAAGARCTLRASVVTTIRPDTVFIPYHWAGRKSANQLTISAQDPISKIPEYKVCAVRVRKADAPPEYAAVLEPQQ